MQVATTSLDKYLHYAAVLDQEDLREFYEDYDFAVLCTTRQALDEATLSEEARQAVSDADAQLASAFDAETLTLYADYFPDMPVREWWGPGRLD